MTNPELRPENEFLMTKPAVPIRKPQRRVSPLIPQLPTREPKPSPATQPPIKKPEPVPVTR